MIDLDKPYDMEEGKRRYQEARQQFFEEYLKPLDLIIPPDEDLNPFPWDAFRKLNPGLKGLDLRFLYEKRYELSEGQASWAVMQYRRWKASSKG